MTGSLELDTRSVHRPVDRLGGVNRSRSSYERTNERTDERITYVAIDPCVSERARGTGSFTSADRFDRGGRYAPPADLTDRRTRGRARHPGGSMKIPRRRPRVSIWPGATLYDRRGGQWTVKRVTVERDGSARAELARRNRLHPDAVMLPGGPL